MASEYETVYTVTFIYEDYENKYTDISLEKLNKLLATAKKDANLIDIEITSKTRKKRDFEGGGRGIERLI